MWVTDNAACMQMLNKLWSTSYNLNEATIPPDPLQENISDTMTNTTNSTNLTDTMLQQQQQQTIKNENIK